MLTAIISSQEYLSLKIIFLNNLSLTHSLYEFTRNEEKHLNENYSISALENHSNVSLIIIYITSTAHAPNRIESASH